MSTIKSALILSSVCVICAILLALTYDFTKDKIESHGVGEIELNLKQVFPQADYFIFNESYYQIYLDDKVIGYAVISEAQGYSSIIKTLVGFNIDGMIKEIRIIEQSDTPGIGDKVQEPIFYNQFQGLSQTQATLISQGGKIDGITGATVTTNSVIRSVNSAFNVIQDVILTNNNTMDQEDED
ncbi:MAG: FMN-binding protein [Candidatus Woesearchaeota archaeon]